jgi:hypothetical protein
VRRLEMLFDLEPYLPFEAFVMICIFILGAIVCWGENKNGGK